MKCICNWFRGFCCREERITTIIGAGAALDFDMPKGTEKPSTWYITEEVKKIPLNELQPGVPNNIIKDIASDLEKAFPGKVHFEMIFHALEMYAGYSNYWQLRYNNPEQVPVFSPLVAPVHIFDHNAATSAINPFLTKIMDIIETYDKPFRQDKSFNKWYRDFWQLYKGNWDVFNFNYDTTIEESLRYVEDGFCNIEGQKDFMHFNPLQLKENKRNLSTLCHMHGCINFFEEQYDNNVYKKELYKYDFHDLYKYPSYDVVKGKLMGRYKSPQTNQAGEDLYNAPIITGLRKPDKLSIAPYVFYHGHLYDRIMTNRSLLVVGYSFGDLYVNENIERMELIHGNRKRVVLIDYWDLTQKGSYSLTDLTVGELLKFYEYEAPVKEELSNFICRMSGISNLSSALWELQNKSLDGPMTSTNGCFMLFIGGFRKAAKHSETIYKFLNS